MKFIDALNNVRKDSNNQVDPDISVFAEVAMVNEFGINYSKFTEGLKGYWLTVNLCTDTWVGVIAVYLYGELIGYTRQDYRKSDIELYFLSHEKAKKTINFVKSLDEEAPFYKIDDNLDEEIGRQSVEYTSELLEDNGYYNGAKVTVSKVQSREICNDRLNVIVDETGEEINIPIRHFEYDLRVN